MPLLAHRSTPTNPRGLYELGEYAFLGVYRSSAGMSWANLGDPGNGMSTAMLILGLEAPLFMAAAWYLEQVAAPGTGNRRHPLFCLPTWLWSGRGSQRSGCDEAAGTVMGQRTGSARAPRPSSELALPTISSVASAAPMLRGLLHTSSALGAAAAAGGAGSVSSGGGPPPPGDEPDDVAAERRRVQALRVLGVAGMETHPILVSGLRKVYPALDGQPPKLAVRRLDLAIGAGECFGLLGPNGVYWDTHPSKALARPLHGSLASFDPRSSTVSPRIPPALPLHSHLNTPNPTTLHTHTHTLTTHPPT